MNTLKTVVVLFCVLAAVASHAVESKSDVIKRLQWVAKADPISDAKKAIESSNLVLLGIAGYTWTIPGVDESKKFEYRKKYGLRILEGTDDVILGNEHMRLRELATEYAKKYNLYLLSHINEK